MFVYLCTGDEKMLNKLRRGMVGPRAGLLYDHVHFYIEPSRVRHHVSSRFFVCFPTRKKLRRDLC